MSRILIIVLMILFAAGAVWWWMRGLDQYQLPESESIPTIQEQLENVTGEGVTDEPANEEAESVEPEPSTLEETNVDGTSTTAPLEPFMSKSTRQVSTTDGTKHSIPIDEILAGGPPKDGIPSIDEPKFVSAAGGGLTNDDIGLGLRVGDEVRFYPFEILVRHELVNDKIGDTPILVSYCPLCQTGVVYERRVGGNEIEFGVSGLLWQSNLLMYNRTGDPATETLWSQVLGEGVVGPETGTKLKIIPSDIVRFGQWRENYPQTLVLSRDTGVYSRDTYSRPDPYGDYYTDNNAVSFGAVFEDDRLLAKEMVLGIEIDGQFKAYHVPAIPDGTTTDTFAGREITLEKTNGSEVRMFIGEEKQPLPYIAGFWFSWVAVHPETELFK